MSERKVLNKYYPPEFDPSEIPRREKVCSTKFKIRTMAPCHMRCTTCGEYIYKGRKFNSTKEDVDDRNHLGLRIYRFYIKCTACLSEISFRTDPENTDYVLEAGATRNFEALSKAEKQAENDEKAHKEETKLNPMLLLEERTKASKDALERTEALEDLYELNKRNMDTDLTDEMLLYYRKLKEQEDNVVEKQDEEFVNLVFGKNSNNQKIKRIVDEDGEPISEKQLNSKGAKSIFPHVAMVKDKRSGWKRGIGSLRKKNTLNGIVVKRKGDGIAGRKLRAKEIKVMENSCSNSTLSMPSYNPGTSKSEQNKIEGIRGTRKEVKGISGKNSEETGLSDERKVEQTYWMKEK